MKVVCALLSFLVFATLSFSPEIAQAETVYWTAKDLLQDFFPNADKVTYEKVQLSDVELDTFKERLGYRPTRTRWTIFVAERAGDRVGYAVFDEEKGQHEPITFAVMLDLEGNIERMELVVYREHFGEEISSRRFLDQFKGKRWENKMVGNDLTAVSGATISSRSLGVGARRVAAVIGLLAERSSTDTALVN